MAEEGEIDAEKAVSSEIALEEKVVHDQFESQGRVHDQVIEHRI